MEEIKPIAMPGTHQKFLEYFKKQSFDKSLKILDVGAGHGAFSKTLFDMGYDNLSACDFAPEIFMYDKIKCEKVDITQKFPYADNTFDLVVAIEVSEHICDHEVFFKEISRILKPKGRLLLSTPNILSLKSRFRFLFQGFAYSFGPLEYKKYDGLQHVSSLTLDQYNYVAIKNGFKEARYDIDKRQNTSKWLLLLFFLPIWISRKLKKRPIFHNTKKLMLGRILFLDYFNNKDLI